MKIGILGGTFNPIHFGHLILAEEVRELLKLEKILFIPCFLPPHKNSSDIIPARHRYRMVKLAIKDNPFFSISDIEIKRTGKSYTIDTIKELKSSLKETQFYFIVGSDALESLYTWKEIKAVFSLAKFIIAKRPHYPLKDIPSQAISVEIRAVDISGYEIRKRLKEDKSIRYLVPDRVYQYIKKKGLYR